MKNKKEYFKNLIEYGMKSHIELEQESDDIFVINTSSSQRLVLNKSGLIVLGKLICKLTRNQNALGRAFVEMINWKKCDHCQYYNMHQATTMTKAYKVIGVISYCDPLGKYNPNAFPLFSNCFICEEQNKNKDCKYFKTR